MAKQKKFKSLFFMVAFFLTASFLASFLPFLTNGTALADTLQGGISADAALQDWRREVLPQIKLGRPWSDSFKPEPTHTWYRLHDGLAGTWHASTIQICDLSGIVLQQIKSEKTQTFGAQVDKEGNVWDRLDIPTLIDVERDDVINHVIEYPIASDEPSPSQSRRVKEGYSISVSKENGLVAAIVPQKYTVTARDIKKDSFLAVSRHLNDLSSPQTIQHTLYRRTAAFRPRPQFAPEFVDFLKSINREDLIP